MFIKDKIHFLFIIFSWVFSLCVVFIGCRTIVWRDFTPLKSEQPVTLFNRYKLTLDGVVTDFNNIVLDPNFINKIHDTSCLDTIPILMIDSLCFYGNCLSGHSCCKPSSWEEEEGRVRWPPPFISPKYNDLFYVRKEVIPRGWGCSDFYIPANCTDSSVSVRIFARQLNRVNKQELSREEKTVRFMIKYKKRRALGS